MNQETFTALNNIKKTQTKLKLYWDNQNYWEVQIISKRYYLWNKVYCIGCIAFMNIGVSQGVVEILFDIQNKRYKSYIRGNL